MRGRVADLQLACTQDTAWSMCQLQVPCTGTNSCLFFAQGGPVPPAVLLYRTIPDLKGVRDAAFSGSWTQLRPVQRLKPKGAARGAARPSAVVSSSRVAFPCLHSPHLSAVCLPCSASLPPSCRPVRLEAAASSAAAEVLRRRRLRLCLEPRALSRRLRAPCLLARRRCRRLRVLACLTSDRIWAQA